jgi:uncharacterized membrane protein
MKTRAELKTAAKEQLRGKWGAAVLVMMVLSLAGTGVNGLLHMISAASEMGTVVAGSVWSWLYAMIVSESGFAGVTRAAAQVSMISLLLLVLVIVVGSLLSYGVTKYFYDVSRGKSVTIKTLLDGGQNLGKIVGVVLLVGLQVAVGLCLLVVPGIILLYCYSQVWYVLIDEPELSVGQVLRRSRELTRGWKMDLWLLHLSFWGWWILAALVSQIVVSGSGWLVADMMDGWVAAVVLLLITGFVAKMGDWLLTPYKNTTLANYYMELKRGRGENEVNP